MLLTVGQQTLLTELLCRLSNEYLVIFEQFFEIDFEDRFVVHVDDCGLTGRAKGCVDGEKMLQFGRIANTTTSQEKPRGADPEMS